MNVNAETSKIRLVVVEDHQVTLDGLCDALGKEEDLEIVGSAKNSDEGLELSLSLRPDVVLLDLHLPGTRGPKSMVEAFCALPGSKVVIFSSEKRSAFVEVVLELGASAFLLKSETASQVAESIRKVKLNCANAITSSCISSKHPKLTPAEQQLLELFSQGLKYQEIADKRCTTVSTVRKQCDLLLLKLSLSNREELIAWAVRHGYGSLEQES